MPNAADIRWFKEQFGEEIEAAIAGTVFDLDMLVALACQETGEVWPRLRRAGLDRAEILALCVGDTIDRGRQAFPKTKAALLAKPKGEEMFDIARKALVDMAHFIPEYRGAASNPDKFCHGFGVFQRDLQFFLEDPDYFLEKRYERLADTVDHCLKELKRGLRTLGLQNRPSVTDLEFCHVAIAYNTGRFNPAKGLKQGHFDGHKFYGEHIADFLALSRTVTVAVPGGGAAEPLAPGRYVVAARGGLHLRKGPGLEFGITRTLDTGAEVDVVAFDGAGGQWARVDLEGDGLVDGHLFVPFLKPAAAGGHDESVDEPD